MTRKLIENNHGKQDLSSSSASPLSTSSQDPSSTKHQHQPTWATLLTYTPKTRLKSHTIPAANGFAFTPAVNTHFRIIDLHGQQVVDFMAWALPFSSSSTTAQSSEHFSASYTRYRLGGSAPPVVGEGLYSNKDRKIFEIVKDRVKCHDMLFMACNPSFYKRMGKEGHRSCAGNVAEAVNLWRAERAGMEGGKGEDGDWKIAVEADEKRGRRKEERFEWYDVHDPFNIFQNTPYYSLKALENSRKGDWIEMKALVAHVVALSSCPYEEGGFNGGKVTDVGVVWEED